MEDIVKQIEEARTLINEIETYCFTNKREKYSELRSNITNILLGKLDELDDFKYINLEEDTKAILDDIMSRLKKYMHDLQTIDDIKFSYDEDGNVDIVVDEKVKLDTGNYESMELATEQDDDIIEMVNDELGLDNNIVEMPTITTDVQTDAIDFDEKSPVENENLTDEFSAIDDFLNNQLSDASLRVA